MKPRSPYRLLGRLITLGLCLALPLSTYGQDSCSVDEPKPATSIAEYGGILWSDTGYVATAPARWDSENWLMASAGGAAVVGTVLLLDRSVRNYAQRHQGDGVDRFANHFEEFGAEYSFGVLGAFYAEGMIGHDDRSRVVAEDGLSASILSGALTYILKEAVGRSRPSAHLGVYHFKPFSGGQSFPSGHATQAFAVASVVSARYGDKLWVDTLAYGTAMLVGTARVYHNAHFASDVLAGALIGHAIGRMVVHHRDQIHRTNATLTPIASSRFTGLVVDVDF